MAPSTGIRSEVMHQLLFKIRPMHHVLFQPQHGFITGENGELLTDQVGRVEDMQTSYDAICQRIGIPSRALEQVNSSRRGSYRDYYDQPLIDGIRDAVPSRFRVVRLRFLSMQANPRKTTSLRHLGKVDIAQLRRNPRHGC